MPETQDWALPLASPVTFLNNFTTQATEAQNVVTLITGTAGRQIVLVGFSMAPSIGAAAGQYVKDWVAALVSGVTSGRALAMLAISPDSPYGVSVIPVGQGTADVGESVRGNFMTRPGSGSCTISLFIAYYLL